MPLGILKLKIASNDFERKLFYRTIKTFHSSETSTNYRGRTINFLIYNDGVFVGILGIGSYMINETKCLTCFIGWNREQRTRNFNKVAVNWRGCFVPYAPRNLGSKALSILHRIAPGEWKKKYGDKLVLLVTYIHQGWSGKIYLAAGWVPIGKTTGYIFNKKQEFRRFSRIKTHMPVDKIDPSARKLIFGKPLHRYWKRELLK